MAAQNKKQQEVNLLPKDDFETTTKGRVLKWVLSTFRAIVIFVELIVIIGFLSRFWLDMQNTDLTDEIKEKQYLIASYSDFEREFRLAQKRLDIYSFITDPSRSTNPLLSRVAGLLPEDIQLISFSRTAGLLQIEGASVSESSISQLMSNLTLIEDLSNIQITSMTTTQDNALIKFTIQADIPSDNSQEAGKGDSDA